MSKEELRSLRSVEAQLCVERRLDALFERHRPLRYLGPERGRRVVLLARVVALQAPDLLDAWPVLAALGAQAPVRPLEAFRGSSLEELVHHGYIGVRYPLPPFLLPLVTDPERVEPAAVCALAALGAGGAMRALRGDALPSSFTRRMGHLLWCVDGARSWMHAVRQAQVAALGGTPELAEALLGTRLARRQRHEPFWQGAIAWAIREGPWAADELRVAMDALWWRRLERHPEPFRSGRRHLLDEAAERDAMRVIRCHGERRLPEAPFADQGFYAGGQRWEVRQLATSFELYVEGRVLHHCVGTYAGTAAAGRCWLFGLRRAGRRRVTLEVTPDRRLVQAKGRANRALHPEEWVAVERWAARVGVEISPRR